jgi:hypothetical protein
MVGGFVISKKWRMDFENLTDKDHIRGALKPIEKKHFSTNGLKAQMGWIQLMNYFVNFTTGK